MINYKESKKAKNSVLSKSKVVTIPAVEEVKDSKGKVVQEKVNESSYDIIKITTKSYSPETGKAVADIVVEYPLNEVERMIENATDRIAEVTAEKEAWEAIKADFEALK
tara:strand:- start:144 stop:470 length:327 start_codon:yes stop_codon:yes gene_type:complete